MDLFSNRTRYGSWFGRARPSSRTLRSVAFIALLALYPARSFAGNACTLSWTGNFSASGGRWTGTGCTGATYIPAAPDTVTLSGGTLTVDQNWTIGASGAVNTTSAIYISTTTGNLVVNTGVALTLRGDLTFQGGSSTNVTMNAGSGLVFDSSQSSSPATTRYRFGDSTGTGNALRQFIANGTAGSHVTVTSITTNGALPGQFREDTVGGTSAAYGQLMQATYTDFSYIGDGAAHGEWAEIGFYSSSNYTFTLQHDAFTFCGSGRTTGYNMSAGSTLHIDYNSWSNTLGAFGNIIVPAGTTMTSGARTITYNVFDKRWNDGDGNCNQGMGSDNIAFTGNYFGAGNCVPSAYSSANAPAMTDNFFRLGVSDTVELYGNLTGGYFFNDVTAADNWHASAMDSAMSATQSGFVMESPDDWTSDSGEMTVGWSSSPSYSTTFKNAILVPSKTGQGTMELASFTNVTPSGANTNILSLLHNTWVGRTGEGMFQTNESGAQLAALAALKSNLAWSTGGGYCKVSTITGTGALFQNTVSAADYNSADSHLIQNAVSANCSTTCPNNACVKQGNGYVGNWSSTPGAHDVAASPYLADPLLRNVALWDTRYLGHAAATQWTAGLGTVAYGAQVSDSHTGYWGGAAINFRCVYATGCITSTANSEPNVGSAWRTYWEFASLYDLRTAIPAGAAYTNVAIGCSGCTAVQALVKWVQRGFTPQNPALWCAGHDGEAIGAVPFCASGKLMLGTFGPM